MISRPVVGGSPPSSHRRQMKKRRKNKPVETSPTPVKRPVVDYGREQPLKRLRPRQVEWLCCITLFVGAFLLYVPSFFNDFVEYDDEGYVTGNPIVQRGLTWPGVKWAFTTGYFSNWLPVTWLSHMLDVQLWGLHAGGHHASSAALHAANAAMLYLLVRRATGCGVGRAAAVAVLFAVHP
jgi:hypothetical protein